MTKLPIVNFRFFRNQYCCCHLSGFQRTITRIISSAMTLHSILAISKTLVGGEHFTTQNSSTSKEWLERVIIFQSAVQ